MRKGWRNVLAGLVWLLVLGGRPGAHADLIPGGTDRPIRLTVEVAWSGPGVGAREAGEIELEVSEGRIIEAVAWPGDTTTAEGPERRTEDVWRLGAERSGRVRARVEAPVGASLLLRAGGQAMRFPLPLILEGPQRTPPQSPVEITVERVAWDAVSVNFGAGQEPPDGVVAPGSKVPVTVGFNVLTPEPAEVALRCSVEMRPVRGGEPVWRSEIREVVPTNAATPPSFALAVPAPRKTGTYVLDFRASWEPAPTHDRNKLIGRLIRRGTRGLFGASTASRRVTLAVFDPAGDDKTTAGAGRDQEVDTIDLSRLRGLRPTATGRSPSAGAAWSVPEEALAEATRRDLLRGWIARVGS
ncbi:MAG: hypothetical protein LC745_05000, partial [Planctomycetia bacterium]|nr:hypothetical protein [Planctomycetia bacterium]